MGMGLTGIPWVPWDSHGNGNHCDSIMGIGMGMGLGIQAWEWELNNGNGNGFPLYLFSTKSTLSSMKRLIPVELLVIFEKWQSALRTCIFSCEREGVQHCWTPS